MLERGIGWMEQIQVLRITAIVSRCLQNLEKKNEEFLKKMGQSTPPISMSEDCLHLNIYTAAHAYEGSNLPVSVRSWSAGISFIR